LPSSVSACMSLTIVPYAPFTALELLDENLDVLDGEFVTLHSGGCRRFLVRWKDHLSTDH